MGIVIDYRGTLNDPSRIDELIGDVTSYCQEAKWPCEPLEERVSGILLVTREEMEGKAEPEPDPEPWPEDKRFEKYGGFRVRVPKNRPPRLIEETLRGVMVRPPKTEWLRLSFDSQGVMGHYTELPAQLVINAVPGEVHYMAAGNWCKTTGAIESHIGICGLLKMLGQKYMDNLEVEDDTGYWKSNDAKELMREHSFMSGMIGMMKEPAVLNTVLKAAGLPELGEGAVIVPNASLPAPKVKPPAASKRTVN